MNTYTVYDTVGRKVKSVGNYVAQATPPDDWVWREVSSVFGWRLSATNDTLVSHGANNDQNSITANTYDLAGRVISVRDTVGRLTQYTYDAVGRLTKTISNYVDGVFNSSNTDEDIISQTEYNKAGQVMNATDPHGTVTEFGYDVAGRRVSITQAEGTALETTSYTCFNKAGWVLRTISNWIDNSTSPDAKTGTAWDFNPSTHGTYNDENLITEYEFDALGRQTKIINPLGEFTSTTYAKDGSVMSVTDQEGTVTAYRYDTLRRRRMVVQGYVANGEDPSLWVCDTSGQNPVWKQSGGTLINHGTDNDQNIIIQLTHDIAGRVTEMRNPRGFVTEYEYDHLNRRTKLENPLGNAWLTTYQELGNGGRRTVMTYPEDTTSVPFKTTRDFDRMGRLVSIGYGDYADTATPNVQFEYDVLGNRTAMNELGVADDLIRKTQFGYDDARRMTSVGYDSDGDAIINETVSYEYDERGLRTKLTFDGKNITYSYDAKGRLISMTDWDSRTTTFDYDDANRHRLTTRHNAVTSAYAHNTAGQLTDIHHKNSASATLAHFAYTLNGRGHRTQANETLNGTPKTITYAYDQLARVKNAKYYAGTTPTGTPADEYAYAFDVAGNRLSESHSVNGATPAVTDYDYNDANRVVTRTKNSVVENFGYDANGNLTSIDSLSYTWDRANRLLSHDGISYGYDGLGNRVSQNNGVDITEYLLDIQPSLAVVLRQKIGSQNTHYVHGLRGIASQHDGAGWSDAIADGLGSVRGWLNGSQTFVSDVNYNPYGVPDASVDGFGFTGEMTDANGLVYLRARYYDPTVGVFASLDPFEGVNSRPMSMNGYSWVEGNVANWSDASGMSPCINQNTCEQIRENPSIYNIMDVLGCLNVNSSRPCCGPDVTQWFAREIAGHASYAMSSDDIRGHVVFFGSPVPIVTDNLTRLAIYGLAVDYGGVPYQDLAVQSAINEGANYTPSIDNYILGCDTNRKTVTLCGKCRNATDLGNFIFGVILRLSGWDTSVVLASTAFNLIGGADESIVPDTLGLFAGYDWIFAISQIGAIDTMERFCQSLSLLGEGWHDAVLPECDRPCHRENLNCARNSTPYWDHYVSNSLGNIGGYRTPSEEFSVLSRGLIQIPESFNR